MIHLMKLELKKNSLKSSLILLFACTSTTLIFTYFFSFVSKVKPEEAINNPYVLSYEFVLNMTYLISIVVFSLFSTYVFAKFIVEDYKGENLYISFTYPIKRSNYFISKILICFILIITATVLGQLLIYSIYLSTETLFPIMDHTKIDTILLKNVFFNIILVTIQSLIVGILSFTFSLKKKSITVSILISILISAILCNINTITNKQITSFVLVVLSGISIVSLVLIIKQINAISIEGDY